MPTSLHKRFVVRAVFIAGLVLFTFLVGGQLLLETLGLRLGSFQVAGGIILFMGIILATIAIDSILGGFDALGVLDLQSQVGA